MLLANQRILFCAGTCLQYKSLTSNAFTPKVIQYPVRKGSAVLNPQYCFRVSTRKSCHGKLEDSTEYKRKHQARTGKQSKHSVQADKILAATFHIGSTYVTDLDLWVLCLRLWDLLRWMLAVNSTVLSDDPGLNNLMHRSEREALKGDLACQWQPHMYHSEGAKKLKVQRT